MTAFDLAIVGAGSGGLTAADFAARLGARVALIERGRIGGDCTWTGCVPSKALIRAARVAHEVRNADRYGVRARSEGVDMARVRDYVRGAIRDVYSHEQPEVWRARGVHVVEAAAHFRAPHTLQAGGEEIRARRVLIATGARAATPDIPGLASVPHMTYETIFDNGRLPESMIVVGGGPIGLELAQAYHRLGATVTVFAETLLPKEDREAAEVVRAALTRDGVRIVTARATRVAGRAGAARVRGGDTELTAEALLIATGRRPSVDGLDLQRAAVVADHRGIPVDRYLRTNVRHIYAVGDVIGGAQFTHLAGWQGFRAARNALLPGASGGEPAFVPRVTFVDPELAQVGETEAEARERLGDDVTTTRRELAEVDRAACEGDRLGFVKLVHTHTGRLLGATVVASRAGEVASECGLALSQKLGVADVAGSLHAYPTFSTAVQQLAADAAVERFVTSLSGRWLARLAGLRAP